MGEKMKKYVVFLIISLLLAGGVYNTALSHENQSYKDTELIKLSNPIISQSNEFISVELEEQTSYLMNDGCPMLPVVSKVFTFPLGSRVDVDVNVVRDELKLVGKVMPSPSPVPLLEGVMVEETVADEAVYGSVDVYPSDGFVVEKGAGLFNGEHVLFVTVRCFTQYSPGLDVLYVPSLIDIGYTVEEPESALISADEFG
jgi:hypothetical protein